MRSIQLVETVESVALTVASKGQKCQRLRGDGDQHHAYICHDTYHPAIARVRTQYTYKPVKALICLGDVDSDDSVDRCVVRV